MLSGLHAQPSQFLFPHHLIPIVVSWNPPSRLSSNATSSMTFLSPSVIRDLSSNSPSHSARHSLESYWIFFLLDYVGIPPSLLPGNELLGSIDQIRFIFVETQQEPRHRSEPSRAVFRGTTSAWLRGLVWVRAVQNLAAWELQGICPNSTSLLEYSTLFTAFEVDLI